MMFVTTPEEIWQFKRLLGDGSQWGIDLSYAIQDDPGDIAQPFLIGRAFLAGQPAALILGDNICYGDNMRALLRHSAQPRRGATVFAYWVDDPERYGVIEFDVSHRSSKIVEKPNAPKSHYAVTGLYFYDERVVARRRYTLEAWQFIYAVDKRHGLTIASPEEVTYTQGFIDAEQLLRLAEPMKATSYGKYLIRRAGFQEA